MSFQAKGKVHFKYDTQQVTDKFKKREFVLEIIEGAYPEYIKFQLTQDKCGLLDKYKLGDEISVTFNLRGKPFNSKNGEVVYFTNLDVWKIEDISQMKNNDFPPTPEYDDLNSLVPPPSDDDGLPF
jgi:hypothetical protein